MRERGKRGFQSRVIDCFQAAGAQVLNIEFTPQSGWPDLHVDHVRYHGWVELKVRDGSVDANQRIIARRLERTGARVCVIRLMHSGGIRLEKHDGTMLVEMGPEWFDKSNLQWSGVNLLEILNVD